MRTVEISVTADHIARGEQRNCERCPIALALLEAVPYAPLIEVNAGHADIHHLGAEHEGMPCMLPDEALDFIQGFDEGADWVGPFTFTLQVPEPGEVPA
jgi:hypothetical protein